MRFIKNNILLLLVFIASSTLSSCKKRHIYALSEAASESHGLPWELLSPQEEAILPDIFYAENSENEQIMPLTMENNRLQIDRLIYPTIGNPNLYLRDDKNDSLTIVLRLENEFVERLFREDSSSLDDGDKENGAKQDKKNQLKFFLVSRSGRDQFTESPERITIENGNVFEIEPTEAIKFPTPSDMPEAFKKRQTLSFNFAQDSMKQVPEGLYDVRMELLIDHQLAAFEFQYNSVKVFVGDPEKITSNYSIINVTDTQYSVGSLVSKRTADKMTDVISFLGKTADPLIRNAAFAIFAGDLHNGGAPVGMKSAFVAINYNEESRNLMKLLKELPVPIFLVPGNHDGYVSMGRIPECVESFEKVAFDSLRQIVEERSFRTWPNFNWGVYQEFLQKISEIPGGKHLDIFTGAHIRRSQAQTFRKGWIEIPPQERNMILYDGLYQWRKTYGPLYFSWSFGKNHYIALNTFDLRQHRRSGWGIYTVNYGGGMSLPQLEWLNGELKAKEEAGGDVTIIAHHDPRGGHRGKDFPYYFEQLDYTGIGLSAANFIEGKLIEPALCKLLPKWAIPESLELGCLHDGLQEWMRADSEFDCMYGDMRDDGTCDESKFDPKNAGPEKRHPYYSGYDLIHKLTTHQNVRTLIMGHTHYNSLEMFQGGDEFVPGTVNLDAGSDEHYSSMEVVNPLRGFSRIWSKIKGTNQQRVYDPEILDKQGIHEINGKFVLNLAEAGHSFNRVLKGDKRELAVIRVTSAADLTTQKYQNNNMVGFAVFEVSEHQDQRDYPWPQINRLQFYLNNDGEFSDIGAIDLDRTIRMPFKSEENPINRLFTF